MFKKLLTILLFAHLIFIHDLSDLCAKDFPRGTMQTLNSNETESIRDILSGPTRRWKTLLKGYFKDVYDAELPDLVIYIDNSGAYKYCLFRRGKKVERLYGSKNIYVLIFSEQDLNVPDKEGEEAAFKVKMTCLDYLRDPGESALLGAVLGKMSGLGFTMGKKEEEPLKIQEFQIKMEKISDDEVENPLYSGMKGFTLEKNNTKNRISVYPLYLTNRDKYQNWTKPTVRSLHYNFGNYSPAWVGASIGFDFIENKALIFGHLYLWRPLLPRPTNAPFWVKLSQSVIAGVNILDPENIVVGYSIGHIVYHLGIVAGRSVYPEEDDKFFCGVNYMF
ncbi:MAG: hypothetical protein JSU92_07000 [Deltaproteobacteria bacterium]|nr:MAG: hypothetical protein JSU92_07000 [Deltaproteobacteria bacterium]